MPQKGNKTARDRDGNTTGIGRGLGQRKPSLGSLSQNLSGRQKLGSNNRNHSMQEFDKDLPPLPQQNRKSRATPGKLEYEEHPESRQSLAPREDFFEAEDNQLFASLEFANDDVRSQGPSGGDATPVAVSKQKSQGQKKKNRTGKNSGNTSQRLFSKLGVISADNLLQDASNDNTPHLRQSNSKVVTLRDKFYYGDEDLLQMIHMQASYIEEKL